MDQVRTFGETPSGQAVKEITISGGRLTAKLIEYGCVLRDLRFDALDRPLTLGLETLNHYLDRSPHFGAIAGRCANRIAHGQFEIDGVRHQTDLNMEGRHTLHGGSEGFGKSLWQLSGYGPSYAEFEITHHDGAQGFPGEIAAKCRYELSDGEVRIELTATSDAPTLCNLAQHSYFNLSDAPDISDHTLWLAAESYTPIDDDLIPTGEVAAVTPEFDFTATTTLGNTAVDHNFVLANERRGAPALAARLSVSDLEMSLWTTEPGVQLYTGDKINLPGVGLGGRDYGPRAGVCLESQVWPDAQNRRGFPSAVLRPGETYAQTTLLRFAPL